MNIVWSAGLQRKLLVFLGRGSGGSCPQGPRSWQRVLAWRGRTVSSWGGRRALLLPSEGPGVWNVWGDAACRFALSGWSWLQGPLSCAFSSSVLSWALYPGLGSAPAFRRTPLFHTWGLCNQGGYRLSKPRQDPLWALDTISRPWALSGPVPMVWV